MRSRFFRNSVGFSLVEIMVVLGIFILLAFMVVPQFTTSQTTSYLRSSIAQIESMLKEARTSALTGKESGSTLPTGGYGVSFSTLTADPVKNNEHIISFIDDDPTQNDFIDDSEFTTDDVLILDQNITTYKLHYDYTDCDLLLDDAVVIFQAPQGNVILKGHRAGDPPGPPIDIPTRKLQITITSRNSALPDEQKKIEIIQATGKIELNPTTPCPV